MNHWKRFLGQFIVGIVPKHDTVWQENQYLIFGQNRAYINSWAWPKS